MTESKNSYKFSKNPQKLSNLILRNMQFFAKIIVTKLIENKVVPLCLGLSGTVLAKMKASTCKERTFNILQI